MYSFPHFVDKSFSCNGSDDIQYMQPCSFFFFLKKNPHVDCEVRFNKPRVGCSMEIGPAGMPMAFVYFISGWQKVSAKRLCDGISMSLPKYIGRSLCFFRAYKFIRTAMFLVRGLGRGLRDVYIRVSFRFCRRKDVTTANACQS